MKACHIEEATCRETGCVLVNTIRIVTEWPEQEQTVGHFARENNCLGSLLICICHWKFSSCLRFVLHPRLQHVIPQPKHQMLFKVDSLGFLVPSYSKHELISTRRLPCTLVSLKAVLIQFRHESRRSSQAMAQQMTRCRGCEVRRKSADF